MTTVNSLLAKALKSDPSLPAKHLATMTLSQLTERHLTLRITSKNPKLSTFERTKLTNRMYLCDSLCNLLKVGFQLADRAGLTA